MGLKEFCDGAKGFVNRVYASNVFLGGLVVANVVLYTYLGCVQDDGGRSREVGDGFVAVKIDEAHKYSPVRERSDDPHHYEPRI